MLFRSADLPKGTFEIRARKIGYGPQIRDVKINNDSNARYQFNINGYAIAPGGKPGGLAAGIVHFF